MQQSKLFTKAELASLNARIKGSKKDSTGIFSARVKPKLIEMLDHWFLLKRRLKKSIGVKHGKK